MTDTYEEHIRQCEARDVVRKASQLPGWEPPFWVKGEKIWVELSNEPMTALAALRQYVDSHDNCTWTIAIEHGTSRVKVGFHDAKHAVMFKLML